MKGSETYCAERKMYGEADLDQGSFASGAVWREAFLFPIPESMRDEVAAPLMCGGATVFNALHAYDVQPTETVGVMGVGGLGRHTNYESLTSTYADLIRAGHLAIQFASKMGCNVVVLSGSDKKKDEAMQLGAHEVGVCDLIPTSTLTDCLLSSSQPRAPKNSRSLIRSTVFL